MFLGGAEVKNIKVSHIINEQLYYLHDSRNNILSIVHNHILYNII